MAGKKKGQKAKVVKKTNPPSLNTSHSPQSKAAELEPTDAQSDSESILDSEQRITDDEVEEIEASQQKSSARVILDAPVNVFDEMREFDSTSAWALDSFDSNKPKMIAAQTTPQMHTPTLSNSADGGPEGDGVSESAVASANGELPTEKSENHGPAVYSEKAFRELQTRFEKLKQDLGKKTRDLKSTQHNATSAREEAAKAKANHSKEVKEALKAQWEQLNEQHKKHTSDLEKRLAAALGANLELTKTSEDRLKKVHKSRDKVKLLLEEQSKHVATIEYLAKETKRLNRRCSDLFNLWGEARDIKNYYKSEYRRTDEECIEDQNLREDLMQVAVAVRLRYLEQAKFSLNKKRGKEASGLDNEDKIEFEEDTEGFEFGYPDRAVIDRGNTAAHAGNAKADAALFKLNYISDVDHFETASLYKALYGMKSEFSSHCPPNLLRVRNCQSTIRALISPKDDASFSERKEALLITLGDIYSDIRCGGEGESSGTCFGGNERSFRERGWMQYFSSKWIDSVRPGQETREMAKVAEELTRKFVDQNRGK